MILIRNIIRQGNTYNLLIVFAIFACLVVLLSCQNDSDVDSPDVAISLKGDMTPEESNTRSTALSATHQTFKLWGYKTKESTTSGAYTNSQSVMKGYYVQWTDGSEGSTVSNTHGWEYNGYGVNNVTQDTKYWDMKATSYRFFGFAPNKVDDNVSEVKTDGCTNCIQGNGASYVEMPMTADGTSTKLYSKLWFSNNTDPAYKSVVQLEFQSVIAKVRFKFTFPDGITANMVAIRNIEFKPATTDPVTTIPIGVTGGIKVHYPLTGTSTTEHIVWPTTGASYSTMAKMDCPYEESVPLVHATEVQKWYYVLPTQDIVDACDTKPFTIGNYVMSATVNGKDLSATVPAELMQWRANYAYTYIFKITDTSIAFDTVLEGYTNWQAGYSQNVGW